MAKFLTTQGVSAALIQIIKDAKKRIVIISPYLQVNDLIKEQIKYKVETSRDIEVWLIYREDKLRPNDREWLDSMPSIKTGLLKNLHAKCYMNEKEAILTSMNLYEFSQNNNNEMGIVISSRYPDNDVYKDIEKESMRLATISGIGQGTTEPDKMSELRDGVSGFSADLPPSPMSLKSLHLLQRRWQKIRVKRSAQLRRLRQQGLRKRPRQSCRCRKRVSASGARLTCPPIRLSRTVAVATRVGGDSETKSTKKSTAIRAETSILPVY